MVLTSHSKTSTWGRSLDEVGFPDCDGIHVQPCSNVLNDVLNDQGGLQLAGRTHRRVRRPVASVQLDVILKPWNGICLQAAAGTLGMGVTCMQQNDCRSRFV